MFSRQKIATVSGIIGSLAVICLGAAHAQANEDPRGCKTNAAGETTCVHKSEIVRKDKRGTFVVKQSQNCSTTARPRLVLPEDGMLNNGSTHVGPVLDCSNTSPLPKGFKRPHVKAPHFKLHFKKPHITPPHFDF
ncbi:hypothetical protein [Streptomyces sp. NPDC001401]|uniref:hypothetical protein n=1 Tax=Streptomyces sp. NPDC001401 TaxID=3364570 RepID=UPI003675FF32